MRRVEALGERRRRGAARDLEDRVVLVGRAAGRPVERPRDLLGIDAVRQCERPDPVLGDVTVDPHLGARDLVADDGLGVLAEVRVPERVVADLEAVAHEVLELLRLVLGLVEEPVGLAGAGQDVEGRLPPEVGMGLGERIEDPHRAVRVDHELTVLVDVAELAGRGVVEREHDGRRPHRERDLAVDQLVEPDQTVPLRVERLEIVPEVSGRSRPAILGLRQPVVLEDHHAAELVRGERLGPGGARREDEGEYGAADGAQSVSDGVARPDAARPPFGLSAAPV